jgi:hypothetical protein
MNKTTKIEIYPEEPCLIPVFYSSNPFTVYNKDYSDIIEVVMCFKKKADDDDDAYLRVYWKDGVGGGIETGSVIIDEGNNTFTMNKAETDVVEPGKYNMYIGVLVTGFSKMLWLRVNNSNTIEVTYDGIKQ